MDAGSSWMDKPGQVWSSDSCWGVASDGAPRHSITMKQPKEETYEAIDGPCLGRKFTFRSAIGGTCVPLDVGLFAGCEYVDDVLAVYEHIGDNKLKFSGIRAWNAHA